MKKTVLFMLCLAGINALEAQLTTEKYALINGWYHYALSLRAPGYYPPVAPDEITHMPFMKKRPEAVAQLDSLIADLRTKQKKPGLGHGFFETGFRPDFPST